MTTKFLDNKMCTFKILLSWRFPWKIAFWTIFLPAPLPTPPPPEKRKIYFYCRLAFSDLQQFRGNWFDSPQMWVWPQLLFGGSLTSGENKKPIKKNHIKEFGGGNAPGAVPGTPGTFGPIYVEIHIQAVFKVPHLKALPSPPSPSVFPPTPLALLQCFGRRQPKLVWGRGHRAKGRGGGGPSKRH